MFRRPLLASILVSSLFARAGQAWAQSTPIQSGGEPVGVEQEQEPERPPPPRGLKSETRDAVADPPPVKEGGPRFGSRGQFVVSNWTNGFGVYQSKASSSDFSVVSATLSPGFDYFITNHIALGLSLSFSYDDTKGYGASGLVDTTTVRVAGGPVLSADLPLGEYFSWNPRLTLGVEWRSTHQADAFGQPSLGTVTGASDQVQTGPWISAFFPLLVHPARHVFLGLGPRAFHNFARPGNQVAGGEANILGAAFLVGGYWGGEGPTQEPESHEEVAASPPKPRFGRAGQLVLTGDVDASLTLVQYSGTDTHRFSGSVSPGVDFFLGDHFSVGADAFYFFSRSTSYSGADAIQHNANGGGVGPRVGVDIPISTLFSLYPRVRIGVALGSNNVIDTGTGRKNEIDDVAVPLTVHLPLLVHPATHFFFGFGPYVSTDLSRTDQFHRSNKLTTVGASSQLGAWF